MIILKDIKPNDVIKVLVKDEDDMEEELYALVTDVFSTTLSARYYVPTSLMYRGTNLYSLEDEDNPLEPCSITEHYIEGTSPFETKEEMVYIPEEIDEEIETSDVEDMSEDEYEEDDFVVDDDETAGELPPDHAEVDRNWNEWVPPTQGARNFKDVIDRIEARAKHQADELRF